MPPTTRKTPAKKAAPAKKAPAAKKTTTRRSPRAAAATPPPPEPVGIDEKRRQMRGEDRMAVDPYAPTVWGAADAAGALEDLTLPSGQRCLAQRPGPEGLMASGMLNDLDMLSTVLPKIGGKPASKNKNPFNSKELLKNPTAMKQAMSLINRVTVHVVVKPQLTNEPDDPADKELGKIYPSSVSIEDKMFLFNWAVGGTRDLQRFREELSQSLADVESGEDVEDAPQ